MSVIRVHKSKNFTVMSNTHLFDKNLSLKAAGLLSKILALPDNWNYSIKGLCAICKENETAVKSALNELRDRRYVIVERIEPSKETGGRIQYEYFVYEQPQGEENKKVDVKEAYKAKQEKVNQPTEKQGLENLGVDDLSVENQGDILNTNISSTNKSNTELSSTNELSTDKEKGENINKVNGQVKTSVSVKKPMCTQKSAKQRYLDKKADEFEMLNSILLICSSNYDEQIGNEIFKSLEYYFERYTKKTGLIHPILKMETLEDIIDKMANYSDTEYYHFENIAQQEGAFIKIIDAFFDGDFGSITGQRTNWHLPHFVSDGVLDRLAQRLWEKGELY